MANNVCNSRCKMCRVWEQKRVKNISPDEFSTILSDPLFRNLKYVGVSGGEPTLRKDLPEIFRIIVDKESIKGTGVITNAMVAEHVINQVTKCNEVCMRANIPFNVMVSLDGTGKIHDDVRGRKGAFENALKVIRHIRDNTNITLLIGCTVIKQNVWHLDEVLDFCKREKVPGKFRIAEFINRLYNKGQKACIRNFNKDERYQIALFFSKLELYYETFPEIKQTYRNIRQMIFEGKPRESGCPYRSEALGLDSRGNLLFCSPKSPDLGSCFDKSAASICVESLRLRESIIQKYCSDCIHDYHAAPSKKSLEEHAQEQLLKRNMSVKQSIINSTKLPSNLPEPCERSKFEKALIIGWYGTETIGDKAIIGDIIRRLKDANPQIQITIASLYPFITSRTLYEIGVENTRIVKTYSMAYIEACKSTDAVVMGGGPLMGMEPLGFVLSAFSEARKKNIPCIIEGCGIGPLIEAEHILAVKEILRLSTQIRVRDKTSLSWVTENTGRVDAICNGDPAARFVEEWKKETIQDQNTRDEAYFACFLREITLEYANGESPTDFLAFRERFENELGKLVRHIREKTGLKPFLLPMHTFAVGEDDRDFARRFAKTYLQDGDYDIGNKIYSPHDILSVMSRSKFNICMRFHSVLFAEKLDVPFVAFDYTGGGKIKGFLKDEKKLEFMFDRTEISNKNWSQKIDSILLRYDLRSLNVVHLCSQDYGGAGKAAYRLHKGLQQIGVASKMLVVNKKSGDPSVKVFPSKYIGALQQSLNISTYESPLWPQQMLRWKAELAKYPKRPVGLEIFTDALSDIHLDQIQDIRDADIINLHWVAGTLDYPSAPLAIRDKQIVWTLHDMNPLTGGCHYSGDCEKYKGSCGACPQLGSTNEEDLSRQIWNQKYYAFQSLNFNIVTPSRWLANCVSKSSLLSKNPVKVIPNGFPLDTYKPYAKSEIRKALNIPENAKVILFGADYLVNKRKGFAYLLEALRKILPNKDYATVVLTFGNLPEGLQINTEHTICSLGSITDENKLALYYSAADVFVIPSLEDNLPNTVVEAMACGVPVVGFDIGGIPDMVEHKKTGFLVSPRDITGLSEGIAWVISSSGSGTNFSERCRKKVEKEYALEVQAKAYHELYSGILKKYLPVKEDRSTKVGRLNQKGEDLFNKGDLEGALNAFTEAIEINLNFATAHNNLGVLYYNLGEKDKALNHYQQGAQLQPENSTFQKNLADFYYVEQGRVEEAMQIYVKVLNANPEDIETLLVLSHICVTLKKFNDATYFSSRILKIEPENKDAKEFLEKLGKCQLSDAGEGLDLENIRDKTPDLQKRTLYQQSEDLFTKSNLEGVSECLALKGENYTGKPVRREQTITLTDNDQPMISVITPSLNQGQYIEHSIHSVLGQNYSNFEHIILDGGSTDRTLEILKRHQHLKWISEKDSGQSEALNKGLRIAKGEVVGWINSDDWYEPGAFEIITSFFKANPTKNIVMGNCNLVDENGIIFDKVINVERGFEELKKYWIGRSIPTQPAVFFRRKLLDKHGYIDETLHYAMDYDLWMRFAQNNHFYHLDVTVANYRFHQAAKGGDQDWSKFVPEWKLVSDRYTKLAGSTPLVSVIIPCYNYGNYLREAVESVIIQTFQDFEIIIVNDGSSDNSKDVAEQLIKEYSQHRIRLLDQENCGQPAISRNNGIAIAKGKYILPLDADDKLHPKALQNYYNGLKESGSNRVVAFGWLQSFGADESLWAAGEFNSHSMLRRGQVPSSSMFHRSVWELQNGYRLNVPGFEDWDFWIGAIRIGAKFCSVGQITTYYRKTKNASLIDEAVINHEWYVAKIIKNNEEIYEDSEIEWADDYLTRNIEPPTKREIHGPNDRFPLVGALLVASHPERYTKEEGGWAVDYLKQHPFTFTKKLENCMVKQPEAAMLSITAIIAAYNEGDIIYHVIRDYVEQGIQVYFIDHHSTDNTVAEASKWLGKGLIKIERFPEDAGVEIANDVYAWRFILQRKEQIASAMGPGWYIHADADEFREAPRPNLNLRRGIECADREGYNAINFKIYDFKPTDNNFTPGEDVREYLKFYDPDIHEFNHVQIKCWKNYGQKFSMWQSGGHSVEFKGRRVYPIPFILRHYAIRSQTHGEKKVFAERKVRFDKEERAAKWHNQYDEIKDHSFQFIRNRTELILFERDIVCRQILGQKEDSPSSAAGYYEFLRPEIQVMVDKRAKKILDVGCASGKMAAALKQKLNAEVWGIELVDEVARAASKHLDKVISGDIEKAMSELPDAYFDTIIFADVLEHLEDPYSVLRKMKSKLDPGGQIIASIPNVRHWSVLKDLIEGKWDYKDAGILDKTHLRFFTRNSIIEMFKNAGFNILDLQATTLGAQSAPEELVKALYQAGLAVSSLKEDSKHYQYLVKAVARQVSTDVLPSQPLISIIILTFNQLEFTKKCLESIFKHTKTSYELIVVDNGSTDDTVEYLEAQVKEKQAEIIIKVVKNKTNLGFAAGNNQGIAAARGDYVLLMNNDIVVTPGWLDRLIRCAEKDPAIGIAGPLSNYVSGPQLVKNVSYDPQTLSGLNEFAKRFAEANSGRVQRLIRVVGFCMLVKRAVIEKIGGLDSAYGLGNFEDDDFSLRAALAGFESWMVQDCFVHHFGSRTFIGEQIDYRESLQKNWEIFKQKWKLPADLSYDSGYSLSLLGVTSFDRSVHYIPCQKAGQLEPKKTAFQKNLCNLNNLQGQGEDLIGKGDLEGALNVLKKALEIDPSNATTHNDLGVLYYNQGDKETAQHHYELAVELMPDNITFQKNLADFYYIELARIEEALKIYVTILETHPQDVETLMATGQICAELEKPGDTMEFFNRVLDIEPWNVTVRQYIEELERPPSPAAFVDAKSPEEIHQNLQSMLNTLNPDEVIGHLRKLKASFPEFAPVYNDLGVLYYNGGDKGKAFNYYQKAVQLEPENATFKKSIADYYLVELGRKEDALQIYLSLLNQHPNDLEVNLTAAHICVAVKNFSKAKVLYKRVLVIDPENEDARNNLRLLDKIKRDLRTGEQPITKSLEKNSQEEYPSAMETIGVKDAPEKDILLFSIIIPIAAPLKQIRRCVEDIEKHTSESHEIIFVNNGATKGVLKWIRRCIDGSHNRRLEKCGKGAIAAVCYNIGIKAARGEYIVLLSNDVVVTEGWLSSMLQCFNSIPNAGIVGTMANRAKGRQKVSAAVHTSFNEINAFAESYRATNRDRRIECDILDGFCMLFRCDITEKIGLFDEHIGILGFEDEDYCLRATLEGYVNQVAGDVYLHRLKRKAPTRSKKNFNLKWSRADVQSPTGKRHLAIRAVEKANRAGEEGKIDLAVELFLQAIGLLPERKESYYKLAEMLVNTKRFKDALDVLNELPESDRDARYLELAACCKEGLELFEEAEGYADQALEISGCATSALNTKGIIAFRRDDKNTAESYFARVMETDPGFGEAYTNIGALKWAAGLKDEALSLYERGFILSPTVPDIALNYHCALADLGEYQRAESVVRDAAAVHPRNKKIRYLLIDILLHQQNHEMAMQEIETAIADFGVDDGILSSALKIREKIGPLTIDRKTGSGSTVSLCMIVKDEEDHLAKCLQSVKPLVDEIIVVDTGSRDRSRDIARVFGAKVFDFEWAEDFAKARNYSISKATGKMVFVMDADEVISPLDYELFRQTARQSSRQRSAFIINTRNYTMDNNLVEWVANEGYYDIEEAGTGWTPSAKIRLFPNDSHIRFDFSVHEMVEPSLKKMGIAMKFCKFQVHHYGKLNRDKSEKKGEAYYEIGCKKLEEMGDAPVALRELAIQAEGLKKHEEAVKLWKRFIAIVPNDPKAYINIGISYCSLGQFDKVLATAEEALKLAPDSKEGHFNCGLAKLHLGYPDQAIEILERLCEEMSEYLPARFILAAACCCREDKKRGMALLKELSGTTIGPGLAIRCHELASRFVLLQRPAYALALLNAAIDSQNANKDVLDLYADCLELTESHKKTGTYE